jgi:ribosomal-protein-alanine N-acetyltransferase
MIGPGSSFHIRPMSAADLGCVLEIEKSLPQAPHWPASSYLAAIDPGNSPRRLALVAIRHETVAIRHETREPVGFLVTGLLPPEAELESIAVSAAGQRQGVGSLLFRALLHELEHEKVRMLILEVRASNRSALEFYRTNGFAETGRRPRYYADPEEDAVLLALQLPSA